MNTTASFVIFFAGIGIGSVCTWYACKKKYEQIAQEEIDSVKEQFTLPKKTVKDISETKKQCDYSPLLSVVNNISKQNGYSDYSERKEEAPMEESYVISPEEFGEFSDYETVSLTFYSDDILADSNDEAVDDEDLLTTVGLDFKNHFGEYEDDSVFVRNDRLKCDYEILYDYRNYSDVVGA